MGVLGFVKSLLFPGQHTSTSYGVHEVPALVEREVGEAILRNNRAAEPQRLGVIDNFSSNVVDVLSIGRIYCRQLPAVSKAIRDESLPLIHPPGVDVRIRHLAVFGESYSRPSPDVLAGDLEANVVLRTVVAQEALYSQSVASQLTG